MSSDFGSVNVGMLFLLKVMNLIDIFVGGLKDRLEMDLNFFFKFGVEILIDFVITLFVNLAVRGNFLYWILSAIFMVLC